MKVQSGFGARVILGFLELLGGLGLFSVRVSRRQPQGSVISYSHSYPCKVYQYYFFHCYSSRCCCCYNGKDDNHEVNQEETEGRTIMRMKASGTSSRTPPVPSLEHSPGRQCLGLYGLGEISNSCSWDI